MEYKWLQFVFHFYQISFTKKTILGQCFFFRQNGAKRMIIKIVIMIFI